MVMKKHISLKKYLVKKLSFHIHCMSFVPFYNDFERLL